MKNYIFLLIVLISTSFSQNLDLNKAQKLKEQEIQRIEELRLKRDRIFTKRYSQLQKHQSERESLNDKIRNLQSLVEATGGRLQLVQQELRSFVKERESAKNKLERSKERYLALGFQEGRIDGLTKIYDKSLPIDKVQQIGRLNLLKAKVAKLKNSPLNVWNAMSNYLADEVLIMNKIKFQSDDSGKRLVLGGVSALRVDPKGYAQILLKAEGKEEFIWSRPGNDIVQKITESLKGLKKSNETVYVPVDVLLTPAVRQSGMGEGADEVNQFKAWIKKGGMIGYILIGFFALGLLIAIERFFKWSSAKHNVKLSQKLLDECANEGGRQAFINRTKAVTSLEKIFASVIWSFKKDGDLENAGSIQLSKENELLNKRLGTLAVIASIAPLLGLLGTVFGMIELFKVLTLQGSADPRQLAGGISVALVTTQMGLLAAIPLLLIHNWLKNRIKYLVNSLDRNTVRLLERLEKDN
jgi:biopolymer transport protein ExbB